MWLEYDAGRYYVFHGRTSRKNVDRSVASLRQVFKCDLKADTATFVPAADC
jgi:hypothetical protein